MLVFGAVNKKRKKEIKWWRGFDHNRFIVLKIVKHSPTCACLTQGSNLPSSASKAKNTPLVPNNYYITSQSKLKTRPSSFSFLQTQQKCKGFSFSSSLPHFFPKNPQTFSLSLILSLANRLMLNHLTKTSKTPLWALSLSTHFTLLFHGGLISRVLHSELTRFSSTHCLQSSFSRVCWPPCWGKASLIPKFPERSFEIFRCRH